MPDNLITEQFVDVFDTNDESEAMVVRGLLESSGIDVLETAVQAAQRVHSFTSGPMGHIRLSVFERDAEDARQVIEGNRRGADEPEETN